MRFYWRVLLACLAFVTFFSPVAAQTVRPKAVSKLDHSLHALAQGRAEPHALTDHDRLANGDKVAVTIRLTGPPQDTAAAVAALQADIANIGDELIEAYIPIAALTSLNSIRSIISVHPIYSAQQQVTSQGSIVHNSAQWNIDGLGGTGVKVGIIDDFAGYPALIGSELPTPAGVRCYTSVGAFGSNLSNCGSSDHGTAVAEALVDIAPAATLYIANPISLLDFRSTVLWMADNGVRVINFSAGWVWDGAGDGTSPFSDSALATVDLAVSRGITFVVAAGNQQRATWTGTFNDRDGDGLAEFSGTDELNRVFLFAGQIVRMQMRWEDSWTNAARDLDLYVFDEHFNLIGAGLNAQNGAAGHVPREIVVFTAPASGWYHFAVERFSGAVPGWVQVQATKGQFNYWRAGWSISNPGESRNAGLLAVGAAHWSSPGEIAPYSSLGPTIDGRSKPDIVGVANADSVTYGPGRFAGTSQASPHVSGLAALVLQAFPSLAPAQVAAYLKSRALPRSGTNVWGSGLAFLPGICGFSATPTPQRFSMGPGAGTVSVSVAGPCSWTTATAAPWITITAGSSGTGSGVVQFSVADNSAGGRREGVLTVAGQAINVSQAGVVAHPSSHDLNGDGTLDLFWRHETEGWIAAWHMDGTRLVDARLTSPNRVSDTDWKIVGSGDFNGDGKPDLFWQHQKTRLMTLWYMDGTTFIGAGLLSHNTVSDTDWEIRAIADMNGDAKPDLIWQHRTQGSIVAWLMDGVRLVEGRPLSPNRVSDIQWKIIGTGDFNGDGQSDLFWRNQQSGVMTVWYMNGTTFAAPGLLSNNVVSDLNWQIRAIADVNDDGRPDLLWQHRTDGWLNVWFMNGVNLIQGSVMEPRQVGDPSWRIAGPR